MKKTSNLDFIRGIIDGDGNIRFMILKRNASRPFLSFSVSFTFEQAFYQKEHVEFLAKNFKIKAKTSTRMSRGKNVKICKLRLRTSHSSASKLMIFFKKYPPLSFFRRKQLRVLEVLSPYLKKSKFKKVKQKNKNGISFSFINDKICS